MEHQMYAVENASPLRRKDKNDEHAAYEEAENLVSRRRSTPVSTVLWKSVRFLINKIIYFHKNKTFQVEDWPISCLNDSETQKGDFEQFKSKTFPKEEHALDPLEACTFGAHLENPSVCILDMRLKSMS